MLPSRCPATASSGSSPPARASPFTRSTAPRWRAISEAARALDRCRLGFGEREWRRRLHRPAQGHGRRTSPAACRACPR
jgi:hypothetical protein